jgi:hypothetical protein
VQDGSEFRIKSLTLARSTLVRLYLRPSSASAFSVQVMTQLELSIQVRVAALARRFTDWLWRAYSVPRLFGRAILGFSCTGIGLIVGSYFATGWWEGALLEFGMSLLIVGAVELGIVGVLGKLTEPDDGAPEILRGLSESLDRTGVTQPSGHSGTVMEPAQVAAVLRELANNLDPGRDRRDET